MSGLDIHACEPLIYFRIPMSNAAKLLQEANSFLEDIQKFQNQTEEKEEKEEKSIEPFFNYQGGKDKPEPYVFGNGFWAEKEFELTVELIGFIEWFFLKYKQLPQEDNFKDYYPDHRLPENFQDFFVQIAPDLKKRGIPHYETPLEYLEPQFALAVNMMCDPYDKAPTAEKLKRAGLNTRTWKNFLLRPKYQEFYEKALNDIFNDQTRQEAKRQLSKLVDNGDLQAIKYYEERQNIYRPAQETASEIVNRILVQMIEILARIVDQSTMAKIASEFSKANLIIETEAR